MPLEPEPAPDDCRRVVEAWNLMGGMDWAALPVIVEMLEVQDVDTFVRQLLLIRDHANRGEDG